MVKVGEDCMTGKDKEKEHAERKALLTRDLLKFLEINLKK
jgi:hypothetical protein